MRTSWFFLCCISLIITGGFCIIPFVNPVKTTSMLPLYSESEPEWDALFHRYSGWLGADGAYSIAVTGDDHLAKGKKETSKTLWLFSDTLIGDVDPDNSQFRSFTMVNHSMAILEGNLPHPNKIKFIYGHKGNMEPTNLLANDAWLQDGIVLDNQLYLTTYQIGEDAKPRTVNWVQIPLQEGNPDLSSYHMQTHVPLLVKDDHHLILFGISILDHTAFGIPMQNDYVYIYGYRETLASSQKALVVARVNKNQFADLTQWRYWNGENWDAQIQAVDTPQAIIADHISAELSVVPITQGVYKGKYMLVYTRDVISGIMEYAISDSPIGPFTEGIPFYTCPEKSRYKDAYCYNAKAHPHLSKPGQLLISYNVNLSGSFPSTNEIYRPRFVVIDLHRYATNH